MFLLDTHALLWWVTDDPRLGRKAASKIAAAGQSQLCISAVTWYEMASLKGRKYLRVRDDLHDMRRTLLDNGLVELSLTAAVALDAAGLSSLPGDPMDRFIVAAARQAKAQLVTADGAILGWEGKVERLDAGE